MEEFKRISRDLVAKGAIIDYYQDTMQIPNGNIAKWDLIDHKGAAAVVAVREDGKLLMVRQYRNALERETLEIPAGGLNGREEPTDQAAMRELQEETGYHTDHVELLTSIYTTVAFCNEKIDIYLARGLKDIGAAGSGWRWCAGEDFSASCGAGNGVFSGAIYDISESGT